MWRTRAAVNVSVIDGGSNTVAASFLVGSGSNGVAVNAPSGTVYPENIDDGSVTVIKGL